MNSLWQDLRYGARMFIKAPGFTLIAVLSIAVGIAANTSVFTVVNAMLFKPMPVAEPERLVALYTREPNSSFPHAFSFPDYKDYRDHNDVFSDLFVHYHVSISLKNRDDKAELISGELVTGNYFAGLGVTPATGRLLAPDDDLVPGGHPLAVLNHTFWQRRFGADPNIVGRVVRLNGHDFTVIGVARQGFSGTRFLGYIPDLWLPFSMHAQVVRGSENWQTARGIAKFNVNGRLKPGVTIEQATAAMNLRARQLALEYPQTNANKSVGMVPAGNKTQPAITLMGFLPVAAGLVMGIVSLVLLVACANVANLLLARASARRREIAVRLALGASRFRLVRQLLTESVLLALAGGGLGLLLAQWLTSLLPATAPKLDFATVDFNHDLSLDRRVLGFTLAVSLLTGLIFGLLPALQAARSDLVSTLKGDAPVTTGQRRFYLRDLLVVAQVAVSLMLLVGAGLFVKSMFYAQELNPGFEAKQILLANVNVGLHGYDETKGRNFYQRVIERIKTLPGVEAASLGNWLPLGPDNNGAIVNVEGYVPRYANERISIGYTLAGPEYFETMKTPLVQGRGFTATDDEKAPRVVVVNETMARRFWPDQNPIGKRLRLGDAAEPVYEVVGVARDGKYYLLGEGATAFMFLPLRQNYSGGATLIARTSAPPESLAAAIRQEVAALDGELPISGVKTMPEYLDRLLSAPKSVAGLVGAFGLVALLLAAVGLYGVMSYAVAQRTREIGIRMALGSPAAIVFGLILKQGLRLALSGVAIGLVAAFGLTRLLRSLLYGVSVTNPATFVRVTTSLLVVALLAALVPARRATKVDPMVALRTE
jgi:putative ABC transport system permease protein